jgi:hypothetical protein
MRGGCWVDIFVVIGRGVCCGGLVVCFCECCVSRKGMSWRERLFDEKEALYLPT